MRVQCQGDKRMIAKITIGGEAMIEKDACGWYVLTSSETPRWQGGKTVHQ